MIRVGKKYKVSRKSKGSFVGRIISLSDKVIFVEVLGGILCNNMEIGDHVRITLMSTKFKLIKGE